MIQSLDEIKTEPGMCQCGCGEKAPIAVSTNPRYGTTKGQPSRFIHNHHFRGSGNPNWTNRRPSVRLGYRYLPIPGHPLADPSGYVAEHRLKVYQALGHEWPDTAEIHHLDGDKLNNENSNLVLCQDRAYHMLIHSRMTAFKECGNMDWLRCQKCKQYGPPTEVYAEQDAFHYGKLVRHFTCMSKPKRDRVMSGKGWSE